MNELTTEEKLNKIAKQSKNIYYSTKLFEESKSEKDEPKIFPRELIKGEGESEKHLWAVILKYKTLEGIPQEVILGTLGDIYQRKEKVIEIINLIKKQLKQNVTSEAGYENFEKLSMYVKNNDIPFKLTMEGKNILFIKGKENIEIERTCFENKQGKIENLYDNENLEQMRKEKNSEINEYIKESRIIQKWKERREKILKSFDTEEKKQKFLKGERITEFLQEMDENIEKQKDITASYLLEAYDENKSEDENPKLRLLKGYLKIKDDLGENKYKLIISNKEVYEIYKQTFMSYFEDYTFVRKENLYQSLVKGDVDHANEILGDILSRSISYFDNEESFYHGFLLGLFSGKKIKSNREAVYGRFDLCIFTKQIFQTALILECKHSKSVKDLIKDSSEGAQQIIDNKYEEEIINEGYLHVKGYGISFYMKYCYIVKVQA